MEQTTTLEPAKRPTFITVLCILSFVGIAISIIANITNYFSYSALAANGDLFGGLKTDTGQDLNNAMNAMASAIGLDYPKMAMSALVQAIFNIPLLIGVLMMWKQRKLGFWIYTIFEVTQAILPLLMGLGLIGGVTAVMMLIFAILFIVLYAVNLKHMK